MYLPKKILRGAALVALAGVLMVMPTPALATVSGSEDARQISISDMYEGTGIETRAVVPGRHVQYPAQGGEWEYGFWNVKFRSYYTVNRCHGSTVIVNGQKSRSIDTAPDKPSIAHKWGVNGPMTNAQYFYRICG